VSIVATTGSTNADLIAAAKRGELGPAVRIADFQDSGRGRLGRPWVAPPGTMVALSVMLRPAVADPGRWLWLPLLTGLAVADGLRSATGARAVLKWPNDVLVQDKKICGILAERVDSPPTPAVVIGIGINTKMTRSEIPVPTATSLAIEGLPDDPGPVVAQVLRAFAGWYARWESGADLSDAYSAACSTIGRPVNVVVSESEVFSGRAVRVNADGCLVVAGPEGEQSFSAGDIIHLR
jgi:BirA family biotin operon repressor/biotin-[acetyl-CoA-carboxylase] ligase